MSRGVFVPRNAELVVYVPTPIDEESIYDFDIILDDLKYYLHSKMPSLYETTDWVSNEGYIFMENDLVQIGVSEYNGVMAIWVIVKEDYYPQLAYRWLAKVEKHFWNIPLEPKLKLLGYFSNGEPVYEKVE